MLSLRNVSCESGISFLDLMRRKALQLMEARHTEFLKIGFYFTMSQAVSIPEPLPLGRSDLCVEANTLVKASIEEIARFYCGYLELIKH